MVTSIGKERSWENQQDLWNMTEKMHRAIDAEGADQKF